MVPADADAASTVRSRTRQRRVLPSGVQLRTAGPVLSDTPTYKSKCVLFSMAKIKEIRRSGLRLLQGPSEAPHVKA